MMRAEYGPLEAVGVDYDGVIKPLDELMAWSRTYTFTVHGEGDADTGARPSDPPADFLPADYCTACGGEGGAHRLTCPVAPKGGE